MGVPSLREMPNNESPALTVYGAAAGAGGTAVAVPGLVAPAGTTRWSPG